MVVLSFICGQLKRAFSNCHPISYVNPAHERGTDVDERNLYLYLGYLRGEKLYKHKSFCQRQPRIATVERDIPET